MQDQKFSILTKEDSLHLMCVNPCLGCGVFKTFVGLENISVDVARTTANTQVVDLFVSGPESEKRALMVTVREMTRQMCQLCQKGR